MREEQYILKLIQSHKAIEYFDYSIAIDWAIDLIQQGNETDNVLMLASFTQPIDRFEIIPYVTAVLNDFGLEELDYKNAVIAKAHFHLTEILNNNSIRKNLRLLQELCIDNNYEPGLLNFYLLYFAWDELEEIGMNYYFEGADLNNIEEVLKTEARKWISKYIDEKKDEETIIEEKEKYGLNQSMTEQFNYTEALHTINKNNKSMTNLNFPTDIPSRYLYKAGGWTSVLFLVYSFVAILILVFLNGGYPATASECFEMIRENRFIALLRLDIVSVIVIPFYYLLFFSIFWALKNGNELVAKVALFCTLAGVTIFIAGVNLSSILIVSDKYNASTSPEMKQQLSAACEGMLASDMWINTGAIIRGILIETGAIIFSLLMLKTLIFSKATGWIGLITHSFDLSSTIAVLFYPPVKEIFTMVAGPLYIVWFILIGLGLFKLSKT